MRPSQQTPIRVSRLLETDGFLVCPLCGGSHLHHVSVTTYDRKEDAEEGTSLHIRAGFMTFSNNLAGNPSLRRSGLTIEFACESCDTTSLLGIAQHKGCTIVDWVG